MSVCLVAVLDVCHHVGVGTEESGDSPPGLLQPERHQLSLPTFIVKGLNQRDTKLITPERVESGGGKDELAPQQEETKSRTGLWGALICCKQLGYQGKTRNEEKEAEKEKAALRVAASNSPALSV